MIRHIPKFKYTLPHRRGHGFCTLNVLPGKGGAASVFLQAKSYKDFSSPTNCIEYIAAQICERLKIKPSKLTLYEGPEPRFRDDDDPRPWSRVIFKGKSTGPYKDAKLGEAKPSWEALTVHDWERLFASASGAKFL